MLIFVIMCDKKDIIEVLGKNCSKCKEFKVWNEFHNNCNMKDGKTSSCKECESIRSVKKKLKRELISEEDRLKIVTETRGVDIGKICYKCDEFKVWDEFYNCSKNKTGKASSCKRCESIRSIKKTLKGKPISKEDILKIVIETRGDRKGKECSICGDFKIWSDYYKDKSRNDGKNGSCIKCMRKKYYSKKGLEVPSKVNHYTVDDGIDGKNCSKCKEFKVWDNYSNSSRNKVGKASSCKECVLKSRYSDKGLEVPVIIKINHYTVDDGIDGKNCSKCKEFKTWDNYYNYTRYNDGKTSSCKKCQYEYQTNRLKNDPLYKLSCNIRTNIKKSIMNKGYTKRTKTYKILKCSFEDFLDHLNNNPYNFTYGDNNLDIDHIIPISTATTEEEVYELNHYTNFQLLPSDYNRHIKRDNPWDREDFERWLYG